MQKKTFAPRGLRFLVKERQVPTGFRNPLYETVPVLELELPGGQRQGQQQLPVAAVALEVPQPGAALQGSGGLKEKLLPSAPVA